jgi:hypothetical protein
VGLFGIHIILDDPSEKNLWVTSLVGHKHSEIRQLSKYSFKNPVLQEKHSMWSHLAEDNNDIHPLPTLKSPGTPHCLL